MNSKHILGTLLIAAGASFLTYAITRRHYEEKLAKYEELQNDMLEKTIHLNDDNTILRDTIIAIGEDSIKKEERYERIIEAYRGVEESGNIIEDHSMLKIEGEDNEYPTEEHEDEEPLLTEEEFIDSMARKADDYVDSLMGMAETDEDDIYSDDEFVDEYVTVDVSEYIEEISIDDVGSDEVYNEIPMHLREETLVYYEESDVLTDLEGVVILNAQQVIGDVNKYLIPTIQDWYIRNRLLDKDYYIYRGQGEYDVENPGEKYVMSDKLLKFIND